jgi:hypothetical protein
MPKILGPPLDGNAREFVVNDVWAAGGEVLAGTDAAPTPPLAPTPATLRR